MMNRFQTALKRFKDSHEKYLAWNKAQFRKSPKKPPSNRSLELQALFENQARNSLLKILKATEVRQEQADIQMAIDDSGSLKSNAGRAIV